MNFSCMLWGRVSVVFSRISSRDGMRKRGSPSTTRGTYIWMNPLEQLQQNNMIREMEEMEHLTRINSITTITNTWQILHLMKRSLSEMNSSHATRNNLAEINTHQNGINREHKLNIDTMMNLTTVEKIFHY